VGKVPSVWLAKSFPSLKPLASYVKEVVARCQFFHKWLTNGPPTVFWMSGFFFTHSFMTAAKQNYARKMKLAIDMVEFDFEIKDGEVDCFEAPANGVFCHGLFIEGCMWDFNKHQLEESQPKQLFTAMPTIWMKPIRQEDVKPFPHYNCPLYKTSERRGILSTTGHSTNFVMDIKLPSIRKQAHWIKRGVAMLTSLDD
jgi:dynein heavy chain